MTSAFEEDQSGVRHVEQQAVLERLDVQRFGSLHVGLALNAEDALAGAPVGVRLFPDVEQVACVVGSANPDITASELLPVVEDEAVARTVEARFDELIAASARVDRDNPEWLRRAEQRQWMRYWPGTLSG